ncbi:hypothetical protein OHA40_13015 [Nocardia sp. NBC_00508]|uniref:hypothetical protein n=1 Tax=Nocardia sp. NBC_00508 TaxID=2975992 RepID=UPI002E80A6AA|nr:hypothetical protein [Nocardia sp. NBC_00508]WUD68951.1 hypothetical protein OHA40_13015 [Nocardia sp. NBC_00508]
MNDFDHVMPDLYSWLSKEYGTVGHILFDAESDMITAIPRGGLGLSIALTKQDDGIRVDLGLNVSFMAPRDDPFELSDVLVIVKSLIESGISLSVPIDPFGEPVIRYTLKFPNGMLSSKVPGHDYVEFTVGGWLPFGAPR